jgi:transcription factor E
MLKLVKFISQYRYRKILKKEINSALISKMKIKFLKSIVEHLTNKQSAEIVDLLAEKKDVNEFIIAKKLGLTINQTRNILYKLSDFGLVSFIRKKDKRKGWYIYFWTLNVGESLKLLEKKLFDELGQLELQLKNRREKRYYLCNTCSLEVSEETALLNDFACPECEEIYILSEGEEITKKLEKEISKLQREIDFVSEEKKIEDSKTQKKKVRKIKRAEAKVKEKRKKEKKERSLLKKKESDKLLKSLKKKIPLKKIKDKIKKSLKKETKKNKKIPKKQIKKKF